MHAEFNLKRQLEVLDDLLLYYLAYNREDPLVSDPNFLGVQESMGVLISLAEDPKSISDIIQGLESLLKKYDKLPQQPKAIISETIQKLNTKLQERLDIDMAPIA